MTEENIFDLDPMSMQDIPHELMTEISMSSSQIRDAELISVLSTAQRDLSLNELLVGLYRKYDVKHKRNLLTARIYRLIKKGLVENVGKGRYKLIEAIKND